MGEAVIPVMKTSRISFASRAQAAAVPALRYGLGRALVNALALALLVSALNANPGFAAEIRLLALGDSLTAGLGLPAEQGFTAQLERALAAKGLKVRVLNAGVSGDTTSGGLKRLDWALADKPQAAIVELGANDMLRGLEPELARTNLDAILAKLKGRGVKTLLAGMLSAPNYGAEYAAKFNAIYPALAEKHGVALYPFFLDGAAANPEMMQPDMLHPNARGVAAMVRRILPYVERLIAGAEAG